jgi:hypothetical protein
MPGWLQVTQERTLTRCALPDSVDPKILEYHPPTERGPWALRSLGEGGSGRVVLSASTKFELITNARLPSYGGDPALRSACCSDTSVTSEYPSLTLTNMVRRPLIRQGEMLPYGVRPSVPTSIISW